METKLKDILREKKPAILKRWFEVIMEAYPIEAADFLKGKKNRFTGPVGYTIHEGIDGLFDELIKDTPFEEVSPFLDSIIKIRAVEKSSPSQAIAFIFHLKTIISEELQSVSDAHGVMDADTLSVFESKIDALALMSFDLYMESREKIYELKASEVQNMVFRLVQRQNQLYPIEEQDPNMETLNLK